uniref:Uncharacterized protein n=1 Tax=Oryza sativa subsp. japonica TaxID=39947 RepID=Q5VS42_ORYSJ|nr:hypothetical protein [Oryza sativa Japonica Group]
MLLLPVAGFGPSKDVDWYCETERLLSLVQCCTFMCWLRFSFALLSTRKQPKMHIHLILTYTDERDYYCF